MPRTTKASDWKTEIDNTIKRRRNIMYCLLMVWLEQQEDMVPSHLHALMHHQASNCHYGTRTYVRSPSCCFEFSVCKSVWVCRGPCHVVDKTSVCASIGISALCAPTQRHARLPPWRRWYQDLRLEAYHGDYQYIRHHYYCLKDGYRRRILNTRWLECQVYLPWVCLGAASVSCACV